MTYENLLLDFLIESWDKVSGVKAAIASSRAERDDGAAFSAVADELGSMAEAAENLKLRKLTAATRAARHLLAVALGGAASVADRSAFDAALETIEQHLTWLEATGQEPPDEATQPNVQTTATLAEEDISGADNNSSHTTARGTQRQVHTRDASAAPTETFVSYEGVACDRDVRRTGEGEPPPAEPAHGNPVATNPPIPDASLLTDIVTLVGELAQVRDELLQHGPEMNNDRLSAPLVQLNEITAALEETAANLPSAPDWATGQAPSPGSLPTSAPPTAQSCLVDHRSGRHESAASTKPTHPRPRGGRILVVDDSVFVRQLVRAALETAGYEAVAAASGTEAVEFIEQAEPFDAIVCAVELPTMDGKGFAEWLNERPNDSRAPLIGLASDDGQNDGSDGRQVGVSRSVPKFNARQLIDAIEELCNPQRLESGLSA